MSTMCTARVYLAAAVVLAVVAPLWAADNLLQNGSFETPGPDGTVGAPMHWETMALGTAPTVVLDDTVAREGRYAVRLSSSQPAMAFLQQTVTVKPDARYVLTGWVRADRLEPAANADFHGTLLVLPAGEADPNQMTAGTNHRGTIDWTAIRVEFVGPKQGQMMIICSLCGQETATGTVWFDDLQLLPADQAATAPAVETQPTATQPQTAPASPPATIKAEAVKILPKELTTTPVSPLLYGHFIEAGFGRQVDGLWAEMLFNRSFENLPAYRGPLWDWLKRRPGDKLKGEPWYHSGYDEPDWYMAPGNGQARVVYPEHWGFHHGMRAAVLINESTDKPARLAQNGVPLRADMSYQFRGSLRSETGDKMSATVSLHPEGDFDTALAEHRFADIADEWLDAHADLAVADHTGPGTIAITIPPGGRVRIDGLSLMPAEHVEGWRRDAIEAIGQVHPAIIRFPGGCYASFYHWRDGIGPWSQRQPRESVFWGGLEYNDVGTAEFVQLCRQVQAEPLLCVNLMTGSPADAADWVAYCNAPSSHPLGALRESHGFREPFKVRYWELDNEPYRKFGPREYARVAAEFSLAMKGVDPSIQTILVGYEQFAEALPQMLETTGPFVDLVTDRSLDEDHLHAVLKMLGEYNTRTGRHIQLCNTEWLAPRDGVPFSSAGASNPNTSEDTLQNRQIRWRYAQNAARQLLLFQRLGGEFVFANFNNLANTWGQNVIECPREQVFLSATGRVFELLSRSPAAWPLQIDVNPEAERLTLQAAWDIERKALAITAINFSADRVLLPVEMKELSLAAEAADVTTLSAESPAAYNAVDHQQAVAREVKRESVRADKTLLLDMPPYSLVHAVVR